jgi:hypothetical protein
MRELMPMRWGLIPSWWKKKAKETPATFNARAETVAEKPMFRSAFKRSRCLIPAWGYYEWQNTPTGKQPYYYTAREVFDQLLDARLELDCPDHTHLEAEVAQGGAQIILDGDGLRLQQLAMGQQHAQLLTA